MYTNWLVLRLIRRLRQDMNTMVDEIKHLNDAAAAIKASVDRADANTEKVLLKVSDLSAKLDAAVAANDPAAVQAVADQLATLAASLDAESAKVEALDPAPPGA